MKRLFVLASAVFFALSSVAQNEDTDDHYFFDSDNVVGDLATYSEKTMDVAFDAPSTIITTPGVWYNFSYVTKNGKEMMRVDKAKMQFKAGGTGSMTKSGKIDVDYQNIKNIDIQLVVPISWQKTRDVLTIRTNTAQTSLKCTNQSQLNKLSAREKYDIDEKLKTVVNMATRSSGSTAASTKMLRLDKDIMITMSGNTKSGMVSQAGLDKLIKARTEYNKRQEEEKARREEEIKARLEAEGIKETYTVNGVEFVMINVNDIFSIGQTEVTEELWTAVMGNQSSPKYAKMPIEAVSWDECQMFIQKLNQLTGLQFRLPTGAEWCYAARGGNQSKGYKYSGSNNIEEVAWFKDNNEEKKHEVATKAPNELGIYDMTGSVEEWVADGYDGYYKLYGGCRFDAASKLTRENTYNANSRPHGDSSTLGVGLRLAKATREAEERARREAEEKARREAEEKARREAEEKARIEASIKVYEVKDVKFAMVSIEGGTFKMGSESDESDEDEKPIHEVTLNDFAIGQTEVTQELWEAVMGNNPSEFKGEKLPVGGVSWKDCQKFIKKLNKLTGQQFRLPTEAEWEYAARGGKYSKGYKYSGSDNIEEVAWFESNSNSKTHEVATKASNELGIYDMSGNVWEWCQDWYDYYYYYYSRSPISNPTGPTSGEKRVGRGGCWDVNATSCRVALRAFNPPADPDSSDGFRLAQ